MCFVFDKFFWEDYRYVSGFKHFKGYNYFVGVTDDFNGKEHGRKNDK